MEIQPKASLFISKDALKQPDSMNKSKPLENEANRHLDAFINETEDQEQFQAEDSGAPRWLRKIGHAVLFLLLKLTPSFVGGQVIRLCTFLNREKPYEKVVLKEVYSKTTKEGNGGFYFDYIEREGSNQFRKAAVLNSLNVDIFEPRGVYSQKVEIHLPGGSSIILNPHMNPLTQQRVEEAKIQFPQDTTPKNVAEDVQEQIIQICTRALNNEQKALRLLSTLGQFTMNGPITCLNAKIYEKSSIYLSPLNQHHQIIRLDLEKQTLHRQLSINLCMYDDNTNTHTPVIELHLGLEYDLSNPDQVSYRCFGSWEKLSQDPTTTATLQNVHQELERILGKPIATS